MNQEAQSLLCSFSRTWLSCSVHCKDKVKITPEGGKKQEKHIKAISCEMCTRIKDSPLGYNFHSIL